MKKMSSFNINDLSTWGNGVSIVFGAVIAAIIIYFANTFFVSDVTKKITRKESNISQVEQKYLSNMKILAKLPQIREEVKQLELVRDEAKKYLPTEISMPSLLDSVYESARRNGIVFTSFAPIGDIDTPYYTIKPISLSAKVGYISMSDFIAEVTTLKRIMNVHSVSFTSSKNGPDVDENAPLRMDAQLRTYIFKE